jgi:RNA polymerase sigma-70 factor (ECF subfamily)
MDRDLVLRARAGDHAAFSELARRVIGRLTTVARVILRDEYLAQDAVQDALVDAWRDLRGLRDPDRFDAWLHRILVRTCRARARREWRRDRIEVALDADLDAPDQRAGMPESRDQIERALDRLSPEHRAVIVATYFLDLSLKESAAALDLPYDTLKSRLRRASALLRAALEADDRLELVREEQPA